MQDKFKTYYSNYMGMHESLTEAKYATPKAEWNDIREYVEKSALETANAEITAWKEKYRSLEESAVNRYSLEQESSLKLELENKKLTEQLANRELIYQHQVSVLAEMGENSYNLKNENKKLSEANTQLRAALEFYTDRAKYGHLDKECSDICDDGGKVARKALAKHTNLKGGENE